MRRAPYAALLILFACFVLGAQPPQTPAQPSGSTEDKAKRFCKVEGKIFNQVTGEAVRKGNLTLRATDGGTASFAAISDGDGKFSIDNVEPGRYILSADRQGFVRQNYGARRPNGPGTMLTLAASDTMKDLAFKLTPQGIVAGRVLDDEGEPVAGVQVQVLQYRYTAGRKRLVPVAPGIPTNDLGEYRAPNLSPGRYYVASSSQRMANMMTALEKPAGKAVEEGFIPVYYPSSVDASAASPVDVGPGAELRGVDMRLRKARIFRVTGKVTNATTGDAIRGAMLMLFRRETGGMSTVPVSMQAVQGEKGAFELRNVPPGPYSLLAMTTNPQDIMVAMLPLDVTDKDVEDYSVALGGGLEIPVVVRLDKEVPKAEAEKPEESKPAMDLGNVRVTLALDDNPMASLATVLIGKDWTALLKRVNPDKYRLNVSGLPEGTYLKSARFGQQDALDSLDLRQGGPATLDMLIASPAAELSGLVRTEKGDPMPGAIITLVAKAAKGRKDLFRTGTADQNGNIRMRGIVPGEYNVFAWEDVEAGAAEDDEFRKPFESRGAKVSLSEGSKDAVQLTVITRESLDEANSKR